MLEAVEAEERNKNTRKTKHFSKQFKHTQCLTEPGERERECRWNVYGLSFAWLVTKWILCVHFAFVVLLVDVTLFLFIYFAHSNFVNNFFVVVVVHLFFFWILHNKLMASQVTNVPDSTIKHMKMHVKHLNSCVHINTAVWRCCLMGRRSAFIGPLQLNFLFSLFFRNFSR